MSDQREVALTLVQRAIDEVNATADSANKISREKDSLLLGEGGGIDSLQLVNLIVAIEQGLEAATGEYRTLVDGDTILGEDGPFHSVGSLADLVAKRLS